MAECLVAPPGVTPSLKVERPLAGLYLIDQVGQRRVRPTPIRRSTAAQAGRQRNSRSWSTTSPTPRAEKPPVVLNSPASSGVSSIPSRLDAVAAHSAAAPPRAIEVNAIEDCTVDGTAHSNSSPAHSGGVSSPGAIARAASPSTGNARKGVPITVACSRQWRAPVSAARGPSRAPWRNMSAGPARRRHAAAMYRHEPGEHHHSEDAGNVGIRAQSGTTACSSGPPWLLAPGYLQLLVIVKHAYHRYCDRVL